MPIQPAISRQTPFLSEISSGAVIPEGKLAYFRARLSNRLHELVLATFLREEKQRQLTRAELARRLGRKPEQITRWFASAGNWELDTVSDLLLGMGYEPSFALISLQGDQTSASVWHMDAFAGPAVGAQQVAIKNPVSPPQRLEVKTLAEQRSPIRHVDFTSTTTSTKALSFGPAAENIHG